MTDQADTRDLLPPAEPMPIVKQADAAPLNLQTLFDAAIAQGKDGADALTTLMELKCKMDDRQAAKEFAEAMGAFQRECPSVPKLTRADVKSRKGASFHYTYAELPDIVSAINPFCFAHGFSYTWDSVTTGNMVKTVMTIRHLGGHCQFNSFECPSDTLTDMAASQKTSGAFTVGKRQTLIAGFGLVGCDPDDDGAGGTAAHEPITEEQAKELRTLMMDVKQDSARFYAHFGNIKDVAELPAFRFQEAMWGLEKKLAKQ